MHKSFDVFDAQDRRSHDRRFLDWPPVLLETSRLNEFVTIINLSRLGVLMQTRLFYRQDEPIHVTLRDGQRRAARVVWFDRGMVGAAFAEPLDGETGGVAYPERSSATAPSRSNM